jgi:hypothetical protein
VANFYLNVGKHDVEAEDIFRAYQNTVDRLSARTQQGSVQRLLTEVRVMLAFDSISMSHAPVMKLSIVVQEICKQWPPEFAGQIRAAWNQAWEAIGISDDTDVDDIELTYRETTEILERYVNLRRRNATLIFGDTMIDLNEIWMTPNGGISISALSPSAENVLQTSSSPAPVDGGGQKRRPPAQSADAMAEIRGLSREDGLYQKMLKMWEARIEAESDVLQTIISQRVTRKFAQKWWMLQREVQTGVTTRDGIQGDRNEVTLTDEERAYGRQVLQQKIEKEREWALAEKTRVGRYCMQDAALPLRLRKKHQFLISLMEMSQVTWVPPNMLLEKGQTIKVINLIVRWARINNYVVTVESLPQVHFKGGQVLVPKKNWYRERVFTLDFASLYPSLMQSHKLCYLSFVLPRDIQAGTWKNRPDLEIERINIGPPSNMEYQWVVNKRTLLPEMLKELVERRRMVKKQLAAAQTAQQEVIYNQRQLALKLVCNSTYGFTGYEFSPWPCLPIAVCTTVKGRDAINTTKRMAEERYNANVIYGDSVTGDTPILIRYKSHIPGYGNPLLDGKIVEYVRIDEIPAILGKGHAPLLFSHYFQIGHLTTVKRNVPHSPATTTISKFGLIQVSRECTE